MKQFYSKPELQMISLKLQDVLMASGAPLESNVNVDDLVNRGESYPAGL